jgi:hypothetical protein
LFWAEHQSNVDRHVAEMGEELAGYVADFTR